MKVDFYRKLGKMDYANEMEVHMKLVELWKGLFATNKVLTIAGTVLAVALVAGGITAGAIAISNRNSTEVVSEATEKESEKKETEKETEKVDLEEYYKEELALDEDTENKEIVEETVYWEPLDLPYFIKVNREANVVTVYAKDDAGEYTVPVKAMVCSVGLNNGTPTGTFTTSTKYEWRALFGNVFGQYAFRINGPILFHSVPYMEMGNKGSLEEGEYNKLGSAASMGCVRLAIADAKWLIDNCPSGTRVEIYDDPNPGPLGKPSSIYVDPSHAYAGWDPTDPDESNPWLSIPAPSISGVANKTIERGSSVDVMAGVSASDFNGSAVTVSYSGSVDVNTIGSYTITYSACDSRGETSEATAIFTVQDTKAPTITANDNYDISSLSGSNLTTEGIKAAVNAIKAPTASDGNYGVTLVWDETSLQTALNGIVAQTSTANSSSKVYSVSLVATDEGGNVTKKEIKLTYSYTYTPAPVEPTDPEPATEGTEQALSTEL